MALSSISKRIRLSESLEQAAQAPGALTQRGSAGSEAS